MYTLPTYLHNLQVARAAIQPYGPLSEHHSPEQLLDMACQCFHSPSEGDNLEIKQWICKNLPRPSIVIEAGAAEGHDTLFFSTVFPRARIFSFEPMREFYPLVKNIKEMLNLKNVTITQAALAEENGKRNFHSMQNPGGPWGSSTLLNPTQLHFDTWKDVSVRETYEVDILNLDWFCEMSRIDSVDLMWLDMQGMEATVAMSSPKIISKTKMIVSEVNFSKVYEDVVLYDEYKDFLEEKGFSIVKEYFDNDRPKEEWDQGNIIAVNEKLM